MGRARFSTDLYGSDPLQEYTNYAFSQCGAKVVDSSIETTGLEAILSDSSDNYMQSPCTDNRHFVIRLCDYIKIKRIVIDNHEHFSSRPREIEIYVTDKYSPGLSDTKWHLVGSFVGSNLLGRQIFDVKLERWCKFVKMKFISHYGQYRICPLNFIAVLGTNMLEEAKEYSEKQNEIKPLTSPPISRPGLPMLPGKPGPSLDPHSRHPHAGSYDKDSPYSRERMCKVFVSYLSELADKTEYISQLGSKSVRQVVREALINCFNADSADPRSSANSTRYEYYINALWADILEPPDGANGGAARGDKGTGAGSTAEKDTDSQTQPGGSSQTDPENSNMFEDIIQRMSRLERDVHKLKADIKLISYKTLTSLAELNKNTSNELAESSNIIKKVLYTYNEMVSRPAAPVPENPSQLKQSLGVHNGVGRKMSQGCDGPPGCREQHQPLHNRTLQPCHPPHSESAVACLSILR